MQRPVFGEPVMDLNQSADVVPSPTPHPQVMHNFMPMPLAEQPFHPNTIQDEEEIRFSHVLRQNLVLFWHQQVMEIINSTDFKSQQHLPLARVKRIMKSDPDVKMVSADTPILFAKACEIFILELTLRSWLQTEFNKRRTLQRCDITQALRRGEVYDFLIDIVPSFHRCEGRMDDEEGDGSEAPIPPDTLRQNQEIPAPLTMEPIPAAAEFTFNPASQ